MSISNPIEKMTRPCNHLPNPLTKTRVPYIKIVDIHIGLLDT